MNAPEDLTKVYAHTASGNKFYPYAPTPEQIDIKTIAHHLACQARWNGATRHRFLKDRIFYSVAEHSVYVADYVANELGRPDLAFEGLLHDATEAYVPDLIRPLKYSSEFRAPFKKVEDSIEVVVAERFRLAQPMPMEVKVADDAVCLAEWNQIVPRASGEVWQGALVTDVKPAPIGIAMLQPLEAYNLFMERYRILSLQRSVQFAAAAE
ncbi:hypothetical protein HGG70_07355 [Rhodobacteraceae bacterium R_SAG4]|nr:hypothetical protein [Rhodobacteraceae bacterium R_SAG4]